jgi:hypothetical protein
MTYHQNVQGWCDIGYHFLVSRDGRLWEGRKMNTLGTHVANNNTGNLGISFMGPHTTTSAIGTQVSNVGKLVKGLSSKYGFKATSLQRAVTASPTWGSIGLAPALATGTARLQGVIYKGTNTANRVPGATVTLSDGRKLVSDDTGFYKFTNLPAGTTVVTATKSGVGTNSASRTLQGGTVTWGSLSL